MKHFVSDHLQFSAAQSVTLNSHGRSCTCCISNICKRFHFCIYFVPVYSGNASYFSPVSFSDGDLVAGSTASVDVSVSYSELFARDDACLQCVCICNNLP